MILGVIGPTRVTVVPWTTHLVAGSSHGGLFHCIIWFWSWRLSFLLAPLPILLCLSPSLGASKVSLDLCPTCRHEASLCIVRELQRVKNKANGSGTMLMAVRIAKGAKDCYMVGTTTSHKGFWTTTMRSYKY